MSEKDAKGKEGAASPTPETEIDPMDMINSLQGAAPKEKPIVMEATRPVQEPDSEAQSDDEVLKEAAKLIRLAKMLGIDLTQGAGTKIFQEPEEEAIEEEPIPPPPAKRFEIMIDEQENSDSNADVFVGLNGYAYLIKRGKKVIIPEGVLNVLRESIIDKIQRNRDTGEERIVSVPRFSIPYVKEIVNESV